MFSVWIFALEILAVSTFALKMFASPETVRAVTFAPVYTLSELKFSVWIFALEMLAVKMLENPETVSVEIFAPV